MPAKGRKTRGAARGGLVERLVDESGTAVDHSVIPWMSPSTVLRSLGSSWRRAWILATACRTVVWSLPPKARPTSASEAWVSWRARYIAICRGKATARVRFFGVKFSEELGEELGDAPQNSATL